MLKKLTSLLLSLMLCLSALPGLAHAADSPAPDAPPVIVEPLDPETPDEPEPPVEPQCDTDLPTGDDFHHI